MKLTSMQTMIIAIVGIVIVAAGLIALLIVPLFTQMSALDSEMSAAIQQRDQAKALLTQLEEAKRRASQTQTELLRIGTQLPDSPQLPTLIIELQDIADATGVEFLNLVPQAPSPIPEKNFTEIPLSLQVQGSWDELLAYLRLLNKTPRLLRVVDIAISPIQASTDASETADADTETEVSVTLNLKAYVIGQNGVMTPSDAGAVPPAGDAAAAPAQ